MPPVSCAGADQLLRLDDNRNNKTSGDTGDDDVFVSLDAFDMLTDLQELDMLENAGQQGSAIMVTGMDENLQHSHGQTQMDVDVLQITDYCPEWAFPEGGVKVLITGPWFSSSSYTVMFDTIAVPSTLVQGGVLRCYCPAHDIGTVTLQVVIDGRPVSTTAMFEYRQHEIPLTISSLTMPHTPSLLKLYLLQKLDTLEDYLQTNSQHSDQLLIQKDSAVMLSISNFENWLVDYCDQKKQLTWKSESECNIKPLETGTTLLHIAAFLGYSKLVCKLLQWKLENASLFLELEVNVSKQDRDGYTPLMWACKKGHKDTAVLLCQWYQTTHSADNTFNLDFCQTDILESVHQYFNDFDQNEYYASENLTNENMFTNPNEILCDVKKDINTQQFDGHNSQAVQMDNSLTRISSGNENKPSDNNILNLQSVQYVKRPIPNSFSENDECYNQFCKPIQYYPSVNQFQKSFTLPLQSPNSDSGISLDRSPVLNKSNFIICLVTSLSEKPAAAVAAVAAEDSSSDGGGNGVVVSPTDVVNQNQSNQDPDGAKIHKATDHEAQNPTGHGEQNVCVLTLAEQFIAAMPEHIKNENEHRQLSDTSIIEIIDDPPSTASPCCFDPNSDISTEFNDKPYRHHREREIETPTSSTNISLSPMSSASQCSPISPPPTAADLSEFLHASANNQYVEKNFSNLTLSDYEQRELYEAAKTIQKAYRTYKKREEYKEVSAASVIQNYYRRYKQFAYYKQITKAVVLIQNQFRSYKRQKRIKKEISHYTKSSCRSIKRNQTQKRQNQAAKKIQHFIRHNNESMPPPVNFAEHTYGYHERDDNTDHSLKYNMPTKAAQYSSAKSTI
ncbi:calmodulin-binding transcription activator 1-like [Adelges cooleyi]|uniref:calmodulin-binding transcription activator 1-like n=1 Tax=Adelges cooleyi TaxID=133065 RepID=UPI00217FA64C|nr:calmodulin-binding transcription activator 1-like [Adelges cooleyi]